MEESISFKKKILIAVALVITGLCISVPMWCLCVKCVKLGHAVHAPTVTWVNTR